jgi:phosphate/sulfate permease
MIGSGLIAHGTDIILWKGVMFVVASLVLSPFLGLIFGVIALRATLYFSRNASPDAKKLLSPSGIGRKTLAFRRRLQ